MQGRVTNHLKLAILCKWDIMLGSNPSMLAGHSDVTQITTTPRYAKIKIATGFFFLTRDPIPRSKLFAMPVLMLHVLSFALAPSRTVRISI